MPLLVDALPKRFAARTLDGYEAVTASAGKALAAARKLAAGTTTNLVLSGPTGVGKSHLAAGATKAWWERRWAEYETAWAAEREERVDEIAKLAPWERIRWRTQRPDEPEWINVPVAIVDLRADFDRKADPDEMTTAEQLAILRSFKSLVVLDDLGREKVSDWTGEVIYALVNGRYEAELPTLVTTNLTGAELAASPYWPAISRLAEDGELVRIDAPDRRLAR